MRFLAMLKLLKWLANLLILLVAGTSVIVNNAEVTGITDELIGPMDHILLAGTSVIVNNAEVTEIFDEFIDPTDYLLVAGTSVIGNNAEVTELSVELH